MKRLLALALVALGSVGLYLYLREQKQAAEQRAEAEKRLLDLEKEQLVRLTLRRRDGKSAEVVLERRGGHWWLVQPVAYRASDASVDVFVDQLLGRTYSQAFTAPDPASFGLEPPRYVAVLATPEREVVLEVGDRTPYGGRLYVRLGGSPRIYVVDGGFQYHFTKDVDEWRLRDLFWDFPSEVTRVRWETEEGTWEITAAAGRWYADGVTLDPDKVRPLLTRIEHLTIRDFVAEGTAAEMRRVAEGLAPPRRWLRVWGGDGAVAVGFGDVDKSKGTAAVWLPARRQVARISSYVYENLWERPEELAYPEPEPEPETSATTAMTPLTTPPLTGGSSATSPASRGSGSSR